MALEPTREIMNICPHGLSINLDTMTADRKRESLHLRPRERRTVTLNQFNSRELQKLMDPKQGRCRYLVDVTAAGERRKQREKELGLDGAGA
ncbi:MAG TPA: hypothetical protein VMZ50_06700 [Phycisphaerae bacterium]|nr:hypothetical protein [Phycisphaerae bacterium]